MNNRASSSPAEAPRTNPSGFMLSVSLTV
jgi:hypothetical protein